jgi:nicotinamide mononucleotide (NMN) deamidase PncC
MQVTSLDYWFIAECDQMLDGTKGQWGKTCSNWSAEECNAGLHTGRLTCIRSSPVYLHDSFCSEYNGSKGQMLNLDRQP